MLITYAVCLMNLYSLMIEWIYCIFCLLHSDFKHISFSLFLQMFFALIAPLSAISSGKTSQDTEQKLGSRNQHENDISQYTNLDGTCLRLYLHASIHPCIWRSLHLINVCDMNRSSCCHRRYASAHVFGSWVHRQHVSFRWCSSLFSCWSKSSF